MAIIEREIAKQNVNSETARINMIKQQCRTWEILDPDLLALLEKIPREDFVSGPYRHLAFADAPIPLGHDQYMLTPSIEAKILSVLKLQRNERVWEIGTGSGYLTALLAHQAKHVDSIDIFEDFIERATQKLHTQGIFNIHLNLEDALTVHQKNILYNVIVITGGLTVLPRKIFSRLNIGGRLFGFIGKAPIMQAVLVTKISDDHIQTEYLFETWVSLLISPFLREKFIF